MKAFPKSKTARLIILALAVSFILMPMSGALAAGGVQPGSILYVNAPNGGNLNLRCAPNYEALIIASYSAGQPVKVLAVCGDWYKVSVNYCIGYMVAQYLSPTKPAPPQPSVPVFGSAKAVVSNPQSGSRLNLRATPSRASTILGQYKNGTPVTIYEEIGEWYRVKISGANGYVMAKYVKVVKGEPTDNYLQVFNPNGGSYVNLRKGPGYGYNVAQQVKTNVLAYVLDQGGAWTKVEINGNVGYINSAFLK
ncbi:MAG: SH3 domain-containing protein [Oscillospiraceae bacterium]|jgi:uncharacterized protein YgiM (DUF1202 family)|nr:SH3 domain-containing protein [Oscillospiraceae bacterium]